MRSYPLTIELVPYTCWYSNVRSNVSPRRWDEIRKKCYQLAGYKCEICGGKGPVHPVECHEIWHYDDKNHIQTLKGFQALCPRCHKCKHVGRVKATGGSVENVISHLSYVNKISKKRAAEMIDAAFRLWKVRSVEQWELDTSYMDTY